MFCCPIMLFISNIDHCPIVEVAICSDIGGHGSGVYIYNYAFSSRYQAFPHPGKKSSVEFYSSKIGWIAMQKGAAKSMAWSPQKREDGCTYAEWTHTLEQN